MIWRFIRFVIAVTGAGIIVVLFFIFQFSEPKLPDSEPGFSEAGSYLRSLRQFTNPENQGRMQIELRLEHASFLLEQSLPSRSRYGFRFVDAHLDGHGENARIRGVLEGPLGVHALVDFVGNIKFREGDWIVRTHSLHLGRIPIAGIVPKTTSPNWRSSYDRMGITLRSARLNGEGVWAEVDRRRMDMNVLGNVLRSLN